MTQQMIDQFKQVTGGSTAQAKKFLEVSGNNIDEAVMYFFESGEAPAQDDIKPGPPQVLPKNPVPQQKPVPVQQQKPAVAPPQPDGEKKKGFFGIKKTEVPVQPQPIPVQQKPPTPVQPVQQPVAIPKAELPNEPARREPGVNPRPKTDQFNMKVDIYQNGFTINKHFFAFANGANKQILQEMQQGDIPAALFKDFPEEERPQPGQKIQAAVDQHQSDYSIEKEETKARQYEIDPNEKGKTLGGAMKVMATEPPKAANLQFALPGTKDGLQVRVKADATFTITCNKTHTLNDILLGIKQNGGVAAVPSAQLKNAVFRTSTGQELALVLTVEKAQVAQKCIFLVLK